MPASRAARTHGCVWKALGHPARRGASDGISPPATRAGCNRRFCGAFDATSLSEPPGRRQDKRVFRLTSGRSSPRVRATVGVAANVDSRERDVRAGEPFTAPPTVVRSSFVEAW